MNMIFPSRNILLRKSLECEHTKMPLHTPAILHCEGFSQCFIAKSLECEIMKVPVLPQWNIEGGLSTKTRSNTRTTNTILSNIPKLFPTFLKTIQDRFDDSSSYKDSPLVYLHLDIYTRLYTHTPLYTRSYDFTCIHIIIPTHIHCYIYIYECKKLSTYLIQFLFHYVWPLRLFIDKSLFSYCITEKIAKIY